MAQSPPLTAQRGQHVRLPLATLALPWAADAVAGSLALAALAFWTWHATARYLTFHSYLRDAAIHVNMFWHTTAGHPYETTLLTRNDNLLAEHLSFALLPLSVLYRLVPDLTWVLALHQLSLAAAGLAIYLFARRSLGNGWAAVAVLASFYVAPEVGEVAWEYWHPQVLTTAPLAFAAYFLLAGKPRLGLPLALLGLLAETEAALPLAGLGVWLLARRQWRVGLLVVGLAVVWLTLAVLLVMPSFHLDRTLPPEGNRIIHKFSDVLSDPRSTLDLLRERGSQALSWYLLPTAGLPLLAPWSLVASLPTLLILTFADDPAYLVSHRVAPALPLLWFAVVQGLVALRGARTLRLGLALLLALSMGACAIERAPGARAFEPAWTRQDPMSEAMRRAVAMVPADASIAGTENAVEHLAYRDEAKIFPFRYAHAVKPGPHEIQWWVLDVTQRSVRSALRDDNDSPLRDRRPYSLLLLDDLVLVAADDLPALRHTASARFGRALKLDGYEAEPLADGLRLRLDWQAVRGGAPDAVRHLELLAADGSVVARQDGPACRPYLSTSRWRADQRVREELTLSVATAGSAPARVRLGWTDAESGDWLQTANGEPWLELDLP